MGICPQSWLSAVSGGWLAPETMVIPPGSARVRDDTATTISHGGPNVGDDGLTGMASWAYLWSCMQHRQKGQGKKRWWSAVRPRRQLCSRATGTQAILLWWPRATSRRSKRHCAPLLLNLFPNSAANRLRLQQYDASALRLVKRCALAHRRCPFKNHKRAWWRASGCGTDATLGWQSIGHWESPAPRYA